MAKLNQFDVLLQKQLLALVVVLVVAPESASLVNASAASTASITAVSFFEKSPSDTNAIITMSKNRYQLSSNIRNLFDFLPQYVAKCAKVTKTSSSYMR